jgi:hypothetical protein
VDGEESEEVAMPNLKPEADDDYEEGSEEEESEFEGDEHSPSPPNSNNSLRRSSRTHKTTARFLDTDDDHSEASEGKRVGKVNGRRRMTRHAGKSSRNYRENGSSDDDGNNWN